MGIYKIQPDKAGDWIKEHVRRYQATDGEEGYLADFSGVGGPPVVPHLLLTTTGRKTGVARTLPLIFGEANGNFVIIASKGGAPDHPAWYLNLVAEPAVEVQVKARKFNAKARTASGAERAVLWEQMNAIYPPYAEYQTKTAREIPVVVLEPVN